MASITLRVWGMDRLEENAETSLINRNVALPKSEANILNEKDIKWHCIPNEKQKKSFDSNN